ncbi:DUF1651 domain-containing protein [Vulcanococcus sp.]|uniref:DUF1651 domain-containing protein n=1 Tax=Vulcanococcus sp. TaxID=2856995 RepID=UPI003F6A032F
MHVSQRKTKVQACPAEAWLSDGQRVLHFRPVIWERWQQELEITSGQVLRDQPVPLLQRRMRMPRDQAIKLWRERVAKGWKPCAPQWQPPVPLLRR